MSVPMVNTYQISKDSFKLIWKSNPTSDGVAHWKLYGSPNITLDFTGGNKGVDLSTFTFLQQYPNHPNEVTPGSVLAEVTRTDLSINEKDPYYFLITAVDSTGAESTMAVDDVHACPARDTVFVDEAGWPVNVVYKNWEFELPPLGAWDIDRKINVESLLGRPAKEVKIDSLGASIWVRFNSFNADMKSIRDSVCCDHDFDLKRGELDIRNIWLHNPTANPATVRIFVAA